MRKEYLNVLRENYEARREYEAALREGEDSDDDEEEGGEEGEQAMQEEDGWREEYLNTLKLRRQHERLELLRVYLNTISNPDPEDLAAETVNGFNEPPPVMPVQLTAQNLTASVGTNEEIMAGVEQMVLRLEKEVVGAYEVLETEKVRIQDLQEGLGDDAKGTKKEALIKARDTLISWLEGQLARTTAGGEPAPDEADSKEANEDEAQTAEQVVDRIHATYKEYLKSREELVYILASASSTNWDQALTIDKPDTTPPLPATMKKPVPALPILRALTAMEHLLPLVKYQKSLLYQKTQLSTALSTHQKRLLILLESTLEQQSHPPPKITAATISPPIEMAQSLAAASQSASQTAYRAMNKNITDAKKILSGVESLLIEVESLVIAPKKEVSRIPMVKKKKKGRRDGEETAVEKGLWGALGGRVGVIGDGI